MSDEDDTKGWDAANLRAALAIKQMSQAALARATGWSENTITSYTTGRTAPSVAKLAKMAEVIGVRVIDLLPEGSNR